MIGTICATIVEVFIIFFLVGIVNVLLWQLNIPVLTSLPHLLLSVLLLAIIFAIIGYGLGNSAKDVRLILGPTMIVALTLWIISGGVNPVEVMAGTQLLSLLPTTATLRILARDMVGLETLSVGVNFLILGIWTAVVIIIAFVLKMRPGRNS